MQSICVDFQGKACILQHLVAHASGHGIYLILEVLRSDMPFANHRPHITKYLIRFVSPSLDWLAWLGLARLASA